MSNQQNQLEIKTIDDRVYLRFYNSELYLDLKNNKEIQNRPVQAYQKNNTDAQKWVLKKASSHQDDINAISEFFLFSKSRHAIDKLSFS